MLLKTWNYIALSSSDAANWSLTIKGLSAFIPSIVIFLGLIHITVSGGDLNMAIDQLALIVTTIGTVVGLIVSFVGFVRKLIRSAQGTNDVTNTVNATL